MMEIVSFRLSVSIAVRNVTVSFGRGKDSVLEHVFRESDKYRPTDLVKHKFSEKFQKTPI